VITHEECDIPGSAVGKLSGDTRWLLLMRADSAQDSTCLVGWLLQLLASRLMAAALWKTALGIVCLAGARADARALMQKQAVVTVQHGI
jgi:hypothetical protein